MRKTDLHIQNSKLKHLKPLLEKWQNLHEEYCIAEEEDSLYWYNERANISVLAGAIWKSKDWFALEEFRVDKKSRRTFKGRSDLWFLLNNKHYIAEAKQLWISLTNKKIDRNQKIQKKLNEAIQDAEKTKNGVMKYYKPDYTLGIVFIVPYIAENKIKEIDDRLKLLIDNIKKNIEYDLMAYCFPNHFLQGDTGYYYPGVVLVIRMIS